jgi:hypothetical protein
MEKDAISQEVEAKIVRFTTRWAILAQFFPNLKQTHKLLHTLQ